MHASTVRSLCFEGIFRRVSIITRAALASGPVDRMRGTTRVWNPAPITAIIAAAIPIRTRFTPGLIGLRLSLNLLDDLRFEREPGFGRYFLVRVAVAYTVPAETGAGASGGGAVALSEVPSVSAATGLGLGRLQYVQYRASSGNSVSHRGQFISKPLRDQARVAKHFPGQTLVGSCDGSWCETNCAIQIVLRFSVLLARMRSANLRSRAGFRFLSTRGVFVTQETSSRQYAVGRTVSGFGFVLIQ